MFIVIQFPFADVRSLVNSETNRLNFPTWPLPIPDFEFIRSSGVIRNRRRGGLESWPCEEIFCDASRAIIFEPFLGNRVLGSRGNYFSVICAFRRFLFNGNVVARVEVGLQVRRVKGRDKSRFLNGYDCLDLIDSILSLKVKIPLSNGTVICDLSECGSYLARHYLRSTTLINNGILSSTEDWWFSFGSPVMLIEHKPYEIRSFPKYSRLVNNYEDIEKIILHNLSHCFVELAAKNNRVGVWFLDLRKRNRDSDFIRRLRLQLFRIHAERECLKQVLRLILNKYIMIKHSNIQSDNIQSYISGSIRFLSSKETYGLPHTEIYKEAQRFDNIVNLGERITLLNCMSSIRKSIFRKVDTFIGESDMGKDDSFHVIGRNIHIGEGKTSGGNVTNYEIKFGDNTIIVGNFTVANSIQGSVNSIESSPASDELKNKLKDLTEAVAEMSKHLPDDKAKDAAKDLEILVKEATSERPRKKFCKISAKGLIQAAKNVGSISEPVIKVVKAVMKLLAL